MLSPWSPLISQSQQQQQQRLGALRQVVDEEAWLKVTATFRIWKEVK